MDKMKSSSIAMTSRIAPVFASRSNAKNRTAGVTDDRDTDFVAAGGAVSERAFHGASSDGNDRVTSLHRLDHMRSTRHSTDGRGRSSTPSQRPKDSSDIEVEIGNSRNPEDVALEKEIWGAIAAAVDDLPHSLRRPLELRIMHGVPAGEIAQEIGVSRGMVDDRVARALRELRIRFRSHCIGAVPLTQLIQQRVRLAPCAMVGTPGAASAIYMRAKIIIVTILLLATGIACFEWWTAPPEYGDSTIGALPYDRVTLVEDPAPEPSGILVTPPGSDRTADRSEVERDNRSAVDHLDGRVLPEVPFDGEVRSELMPVDPACAPQCTGVTFTVDSIDQRVRGSSCVFEWKVSRSSSSGGTNEFAGMIEVERGDQKEVVLHCDEMENCPRFRLIFSCVDPGGNRDD